MIEAARAGDAGKRFAVVVDEIRNLSTETQESSSRIMAALANLGTTSVKMTDSIGQTIDLIQETSEKVAVVNESVSGIAKDAAELEQHLSVIDSAMQDVKESNHQMVSNMEGICNVMNAMTDSIGSAEAASGKRHHMIFRSWLIMSFTTGRMFWQTWKMSREEMYAI